MANKRKTLRKLCNNGGAFLLLLVITFLLLFKDIQPEQLLAVVKQANPLYLLVGVGAMSVFVLCESINIGRGLKLFGYQPGFWQCIKYSAAGFFFSSITPSASGGQPMQVYYMHKDKIALSHSTLALLIELASFQFVTVSFAVVGFLTQHQVMYHNLGNIKILLVIGLVFNLIVLLFILTAIFSKKLSNGCIRLVGTILAFFKYKKVEEFNHKAQTHLLEYQKSAAIIINNKIAVLKILLTTCLQVAAVHSIPYWVYRSMGLDSQSLFTVLSMQAVLYISVSALPLPGAVGISESGFMLLFKTLFPIQLLSGSMLLSRGISFYLFVIITGIGLGVYAVRLKTKAKGKVEAELKQEYCKTPHMVYNRESQSNKKSKVKLRNKHLNVTFCGTIKKR